MPSNRIVNAFDIVNYLNWNFISGTESLSGGRSVFSEDKKLSIAELSQTLPARLMLQVTQSSASRCWNYSLVY